MGDDSQVYTVLRLHLNMPRPSRLWRLARTGGVKRKLYARLYTCEMTETSSFWWSGMTSRHFGLPLFSVTPESSDRG